MTSLLESLTEEVRPLVAPVPGANAAGTDISVDPLFDDLKAEVDKMSSPTGGAPDWHRALSLGEQLTTEKAKDMRVMTWYALACARGQGIRGAAKGLLALERVTAEYWDPMFPAVARLKARANLVEWLGEQLSSWLLSVSLQAADREALAVLRQVQSDFDTVMREKLGKLHPGMGRIRSALTDKERELPHEPSPAPGQGPAASPPRTAAPGPSAASAGPEAVAPPAPIPSLAQPAPATAGGVAPPGDATGSATVTSAARSGSAAGVLQAPSEPSVPVAAPPPPQIRSGSGAPGVLPALGVVARTLGQAAAHLRDQDPAAAWAYELQRTGAWLTVTEAPPHEDSKTLIPEPDDDDRQRLDAALKGEQWMVLLGLAEELTATYVFWFDLHRLVTLAMDRLGALFLDARATVARQVVAFSQRHPTIPSLTFAGGTPFADAATRAWLEEETARQYPRAASRLGSVEVVTLGENSDATSRLAEAKELVGTGRAFDGLSLASELAARAGDGRSRFRVRLTMARLALQAGKPELAVPIFAALSREAEEYRLDTWEPRLCVELYASWLSALPPEEARSSPAFERLANLDPATALKLVTH